MTLNATQEKDLETIRQSQFLTKRATVGALEEILYEPIPVLDHGFVRVIDYMGDDSAIVQAARVSYGKGTKKANEDTGLINYLMRHRHTTPFEMCEIKFHIKLPIFVARQWVRHRTANINEYSARYSILDKEFYIPKLEHLSSQSMSNNQGRGDTLSGDEANRVLEWLKEDALNAYDHYQKMLNVDEQGQKVDDDAKGLARELARMNLPVNFYTQWYWKIDLHNLLHFLSLRADTHAQYEIRVYAEIMLDIVRRWVPATYEAFTNYRLEAVHISKSAWRIIQRQLQGETVTFEDSGMSRREWLELQEQLSR